MKTAFNPKDIHYQHPYNRDFRRAIKFVSTAGGVLVYAGKAGFRAAAEGSIMAGGSALLIYAGVRFLYRPRQHTGFPRNNR